MKLSEKHLAMQHTLSAVGRMLVFGKAKAQEILIPVLVEEAMPLQIHSIVEGRMITQTHSGGER